MQQAQHVYAIAGFSVGYKNWFLNFVHPRWTVSEMVGLDISPEDSGYIFKPSYSPHCINSNVGANSFGQISLQYERTDYYIFSDNYFGSWTADKAGTI